MAHGKDIAWKRIGYVGGALALGMLAGAFILAPKIENWKKKRETAKLPEKKKTVLKKTA